MPTILCIIGTRPEALKMIPVIRALKKDQALNCGIIATAQHRDMLDQVLSLFDIKPDIDLNLMQHGQTLNSIAARMLVALEKTFLEYPPDAILAQGDTTTVLAAALSAFHLQIPFGHVEAGLRTHDRQQPFPEEMNRVLTAQLTEWHFAPTRIAKDNLIQEGIPKEKIYVTGNTIVDMVRSITENKISSTEDSPHKHLILVTVHRRESFGKPLLQIFDALRQIADTHENIEMIYPVHPNPNVEPVARKILSAHPRIKLTKPLDYISFINLMKKARLVISDSGGIQEEAIVLGKPVILLREKTERPEGVTAGNVVIAGHNKNAIITQTNAFLKNTFVSPEQHSPYGDGFAAEKIRDILLNYFAHATTHA